MKTLRILGLVLVCMAGCTQSPDEEARSHQRAAIKLCWKNQAAKSLSPEAARFVAGACEKMEADYRAKWNREP